MEERQRHHFWTGKEEEEEEEIRMAVVSPGGCDNHNNHDGPMDVGVDVEDLLSYHRVKDGDGGGNGIVPSSSVVGRIRIHGRQIWTT